MLDPLYLYELAERLGMTVSELLNGRGAPPDLHELAVGWPAYLGYKNRSVERENAAMRRSDEAAQRRVTG